MTGNAPARRLPRIVRILRMRPRLLTSAAVALIVIVALYAICPDWRTSTRLLVGWDVGVTAYLLFSWQMALRASFEKIRSRAALQDEGALAVLLLPVAAAVASLAAIFAELVIAKGSDNRALHVSLAILTIALSWTFIQVIFALHYAHEYYGNGKRANGLQFPGDDKPDYWDFAYFSFVVGMTFQVSDVQVTNRAIRRLVVAHGILSFVFNTAILALTVNLASSGA